jgi:hypothetical protein
MQALVLMLMLMLMREQAPVRRRPSGQWRG